MTVSEVEPLLPKHHEPVNDGQTEEEGSKLSTRRIFSIVVALLGERSTRPSLVFVPRSDMFRTGVVLANADDSFVYATYETIASEYKRLSDAPFLLTAYNLGYCVALPVVRRRTLLLPLRSFVALCGRTSMSMLPLPLKISVGRCTPTPGH